MILFFFPGFHLNLWEFLKMGTDGMEHIDHQKMECNDMVFQNRNEIDISLNELISIRSNSGFMQVSCSLC